MFPNQLYVLKNTTMRVLNTLRFCEYLLPKKARLCSQKPLNGLAKSTYSLFFFMAFLPFAFSSNFIEFEGGKIFVDDLDQVMCENVTNGGEIEADEFGCPNPTWDPSLITSVSLPTGGTGTLEYIWIFTTDDPTLPNAFWNPIPGSTGPEYDPDPITETTYYRRCARRSGCTDYIGESNIIVKEAICCDNLTDGGQIIADQTLCSPPFTADPLTNFISPSGGGTEPIEYQWAISTTGTPYAPTNPDWTFIAGANDPDYDPGTLSETTYFIRLSRRHGCLDYDGVSNIIQIYVGEEVLPVLEGTPVSCIGGSDGLAAVVSITGGEPIYTFQWTGFPGAVNDTLSGLMPGTYEVVVTDARGCTGTGSAIVEEADSLILNTFHSDALCDDSSDGTATANVTGGVVPYTYLWDDPAGQTTTTATGLPAGTYTVTVTDGNGCTAIASEAVGAPVPIVLVLDSTNVLCFGANDGTAEVAVENGNIDDFNVMWSDGQTTPVATGLAPGTYGVTVSNANGCSEEGSLSISEPTTLMLVMDADSASCFGSSDGTATVTVSGGTPFPNNVYEYVWDANGNPAVPMLDDVSPGTYTVTVTDANGCTAVDSVEIAAPDEITMEVTTVHVTCNGLSDGSIFANVSGGIQPYDFSWDDPNNSTSAFIDNLPAGIYGLTVTDANGCVATNLVTVTEPDPLALNFNNTHVICPDDTNGIASVMPSGGTPTYIVTWSNGSAGKSAFNVGVGTYMVTVTDFYNCEIVGTTEIMATTTLSSTVAKFDATCFDVNNGVAIANGVDGTPPYQYLWSNGETTSQINDLFVGTYDVTVTDGDGCSVTNSVTVGSPPMLTTSVQILSEITTYGGTDGSATVNVTGGVMPYSYEWSNGEATAVAVMLGDGTHTVTITDANDCTITAEVTLIEPSKIGDYVWDDANQNGIQDVTEVGIEGIDVYLTGVTSVGDSVNLMTTTDADGFYAFDGLDQGFYMLEFETPPNHVVTYQDIGNEALDSDPDPTTGKTPGFPISQGEYEDRWDAGLIVLDEKIDIGDKVWYDTNHDGLQGSLEAGVEGIVVRLREMSSNNIIAVDVTDILGNYLFEDVLPGDYKVEFSMASFPPGGYIISPKDVGMDDTIDSDPDTLTGITDQFTVLPFTLDNLTIDAGIFKECDNITDGGVIGYDEELCGVGADPAEIVDVVPPSGGYGTIEYLWLQSAIPVYNGQGDPNWTIIPNSNSASYDPGPITQSTYYIRCARRAGCDDYIGESNVVAKEITPFPLAQIIDQPGLICMNEDSRFEAAIAGAGATYFWEFGGGGSPATATTRVVDPVSWSTAGIKNVTLTVTRFGCPFSVSTNIVVDDCVFSPLIAFNNFFADIEGESIRLKWEVAGNTDNTIFVVQRSNDGQEFTTIGNLNGQAGTAVSHYAFVDEQPRFGENIYRIRYEKLGTELQSGFSETAQAIFQLHDEQFAQVFPNPTDGEITVELLNPSEEVVIGEVFTPLGRSILVFEMPANAKQFTIDLGQHEQGLYLVKIKQPKLKAQICKVFKNSK